MMLSPFELAYGFHEFGKIQVTALWAIVPATSSLTARHLDKYFCSASTVIPSASNDVGALIVFAANHLERSALKDNWGMTPIK